ncbi:hypothetical protein QJS66_03115 [Kocuria rhizophila]|nr:hypothetical protein QJS66_03115 [Kocuria rhizophila]
MPITLRRSRCSSPAWSWRLARLPGLACTWWSVCWVPVSPGSRAVPRCWPAAGDPSSFPFVAGLVGWMPHYFARGTRDPPRGILRRAIHRRSALGLKLVGSRAWCSDAMGIVDDGQRWSRCRLRGGPRHVP